MASSRVGTRISADRVTGGAAGDGFEHRQGECRRLARAGRSLSEQVPPGDEVRDGLPLDRRRLLVAQIGQGREDLGPQAQRGEAARFIDTLIIHRGSTIRHGTGIRRRCASPADSARAPLGFRHAARGGALMPARSARRR